MAITADYLLEGVKRRITMPASQVRLTNAGMLQVADAIISSRIVPLMESVNQEYFVRLTEEPLVAGVSEYSIPYRAVGRALRELKLKTSETNVMNIAKIALEDVQIFQPSALTVGFYFRGDKYVLVPDVPSSIGEGQSLQVFWRLPPSSLVQASQAMRVVSVTGDTVTVANVPSLYQAGTSIDFIQAKSGNSIYEMDVDIVSINGTTLTFGTDEVPAALVAGDYISVAGTSPVINFVPNECYSLIESYTAQRVCNIIGDTEGAAVIRDSDLTLERDNILKLLEPRIDGEPTVIINRYSLVRGNKFSQRSWLYGGG